MGSEAVFHPWVAQAKVSPVVVAGGSGAWFWNHEGDRWLDLHSQLGNLHLGHQHPALVAAICRQAAELCTLAPSLGSEIRNRAARMILDVAPGEMRSVLFTTAGADAVEHALRMARVATGRPKILAAHRSYHGATEGAMGVTGDPRRWALPSHGRRHRPLLRPLPVPLGLPRHHRRRRSATVRSTTCAACSPTRARRRSRRSSSSRSSAATACSCRPTATSRASGNCATSTASC